MDLDQRCTCGGMFSSVKALQHKAEGRRREGQAAGQLCPLPRSLPLTQEAAGRTEGRKHEGGTITPARLETSLRPQNGRRTPAGRESGHWTTTKVQGERKHAPVV